MSIKSGALVASAALLVAALAGYLLVGADGDRAPAAASRPSPAAAPVQPAPGGGSVTETVAPGPEGPTVESAITRPARLADGVRVEVLRVRSTSVKPRGPGEVGGPAVVVRLEVVNGSPEPIDVAGAIVTLLDGDEQVAQPSTSAPAAPFRSALQPGASGRATYVFRVPQESAGPVTVVVQYAVGRGVVRFVS